ncbi:MAG: potassium channel family protein [Rhizobiaceae bacterium]|nr:potassium channel family protein [Rhizobiaceae bacterium]
MDKASKTPRTQAGTIQRVRATLRRLYHGKTKAALRFQLAVIVVDVAIIAFFIVSPFLEKGRAFLWLDYSIAALLAADLVARALAAERLSEWVRRIYVWVDVFILATLLLPNSLANLGFLRILRLWSLSRSGTLWRPLERSGFGEWREPVHAVMNLVTFLFVATGFIYTWFFRSAGGIEGYIDALYFTVAAITTTGFGDIVLPGGWGKFTSIVIMIIGISLFVRLAQAIFRPNKVFFPCPECALQRHDPDAVHCKACGHKLKIPDEGI